MISATCACLRGIKCHHIVALARFGHYNTSITDSKCTWNVLVKTDELYPPKPYAAIEEVISIEQKKLVENKTLYVWEYCGLHLAFL